MIIAKDGSGWKPASWTGCTTRAIAMIEETRKETVGYFYGRAPEEPDVMRIAGIWTGRDALTAHFQSPAYGNFQQGFVRSGELGHRRQKPVSSASRTLVGGD